MWEIYSQLRSSAQSGVSGDGGIIRSSDNGVGIAGRISGIAAKYRTILALEESYIHKPVSTRPFLQRLDWRATAI